MKNYFLTSLLLLVSVISFAQQASEIDPKFVKLPRYANLTAITTAIPTPTQGMMVYNIGTTSNWYYNGTAWTNTAGGGSLTLPYSQTQANAGTLFSLANSGSGSVGEFVITNPINSNTTLYSYSFGTGGAGDFRINNATNSQTALYASTDGTGYAIYGVQNGSGGAITGITFGNGSAGYFRNQNVLNFQSSLLSINDGLAGAGDFRITNSANAGNAIYGRTVGTGFAGVFEVVNPANTGGAIYAITNGTGNSISSKTTGTGKAGVFEINNALNNSIALHALTDGTSNAALFQINNPLNTSDVVITSQYGLGKAGVFEINNPSNNNIALHTWTNGGGNTFYSYAEGTGKAGVFEINNGSNANIALHAFTNGTGKAAYFQGTNALETNGTVKFGGSGVGTPAAGKVLTATDGLGNATWQAIPALTVPLSLTHSTSTPFETTFAAYTTGTNGRAGEFSITNASNTENALFASTTGIGNAFYATTSSTGTAIGASTNTGKAGFFEISSPANSNDVLSAATTGNGIALNASTSGTGNAIRGTTYGTGKAAYFQGTNALETSGTIKFGGLGVGTIAAGKVLTATDASGNATWQAIPAVTAPLNLTSLATTLQSIASGVSGFAGDFQITNSSNTTTTLRAFTNGTGGAGIFSIANVSNINNALHATTNGTGKAAYFQGTNALETDGTIKFGGSGVGTPATGKVLTATDALGNATWQSIPAVAAPLSLSSTATTLTSTSTIGTAANFSSTSGYALVTGTGNVGIGTATPAAKLDVAGYTKLGDDATAPKIKMKELATFNTASGASAGLTSQAHGLTASKIISVSILVNVTGNLWVPPVYTSDPRLNYNYFIFTNDIFIQNSSSDCTSPGDHICGKPVKVLITYKE